jgi:hypothetical protein
METARSFAKEQLHVDVTERAEEITVAFTGKSILRDPNDFVLPILLQTLSEANAGKKRMMLDFRGLSYMNSSTLTPIIKILERARVGDGRVTIAYSKSQKWQEVSFSALVIFQTKDGRIEIRGT